MTITLISSFLSPIEELSSHVDSYQSSELLLAIRHIVKCNERDIAREYANFFAALSLSRRRSHKNPLN